jgi:hypothetical protein
MSAFRAELIDEIQRLTKVVEAIDAAGNTSGTSASDTGLGLKLYKRRSQSPEARARISAYQKKKWEMIRAIRSGAVTLESLPANERAMIEHVAGTPLAKPAVDPAAHERRERSVTVASAGNWNPVGPTATGRKGTANRTR